MTSMRFSPSAIGLVKFEIENARSRCLPNAPHLQPLLTVPDQMSRHGRFTFAANEICHSHLSVADALDACDARYVNFVDSQIENVVYKIHNNAPRRSLSPEPYSPHLWLLCIPGHCPVTILTCIQSASRLCGVKVSAAVDVLSPALKEGGSAPSRSRLALPPCLRRSQAVSDKGIGGTGRLSVRLVGERPHALSGEPVGRRRRYIRARGIAAVPSAGGQKPSTSLSVDTPFGASDRRRRRHDATRPPSAAVISFSSVAELLLPTAADRRREIGRPTKRTLAVTLSRHHDSAPFLPGWATARGAATSSTRRAPRVFLSLHQGRSQCRSPVAAGRRATRICVSGTFLVPSP